MKAQALRKGYGGETFANRLDWNFFMKEVIDTELCTLSEKSLQNFGA